MDILCVPVGPLQANCYIVWNDDHLACAVDPGGEPVRLDGIIRQRGLTLEAIAVTHGHFDHVEGVKSLADVTGAKVYCSAGTVAVLTGVEGCMATGLAVPALDQQMVHVVDDGSEFNVGSLRVVVIGTPGHTPADITFEIEGHLFPGDLVFYRSVGRTDFPGGDFGQLLTSVRKLVERYPEATPLHPGHMQSTTLGDELAFNPFLERLSDRG